MCVCVCMCYSMGLSGRKVLIVWLCFFMDQRSHLRYFAPMRKNSRIYVYAYIWMMGGIGTPSYIYIHIESVVIYFNRSKTHYLDFVLQHFNKCIQNISTFHHRNGQKKKREWLIAQYSFSFLVCFSFHRLLRFQILIRSCTLCVRACSIYIYKCVMLTASSIAGMIWTCTNNHCHIITPPAPPTTITTTTKKQSSHPWE